MGRTRASRVCSTPGCPTLTAGGRCPDCRRDADQARGTASARGYGAEHRGRFRAGVLARDRQCVLCPADQPAPATIADHWPLSRRELEAAGLDPDDPANGRGLCVPCHGRETARHQPGGWNAR